MEDWKLTRRASRVGLSSEIKMGIVFGLWPLIKKCERYS